MTTIDRLKAEEIEIAERINRCARKLEESSDEDGGRARQHLDEAIAAWKEFRKRHHLTSCTVDDLLTTLQPQGRVMIGLDNVFVGDRPSAWPEDDSALFVPLPDWAKAHLEGLPQPCPASDLLALAVENRIPRAVVLRWLELNRLPADWCPAELT